MNDRNDWILRQNPFFTKIDEFQGLFAQNKEPYSPTMASVVTNC